MEHARGALVTGGSRGLGRAIAERLAREGASVGVLARSPEAVEATVASIGEAGGRAYGLPCDVLDLARLRTAMEEFRDWAGRFDALVCAAGRLRAVGPLAAVDPELWWRDLETSVRGAQHAIREALPHLHRSPRASVSLLVGPGHHGELPFATGYAAGQAALVRLAESLAHELRSEGVAIFAVHPGLVLTDLTRRWLDSPEGRRWLPQWTEAFAEGKEVGPEVVAEMVAWLVENRPQELTGRVVPAPLPPAILETRLDRIRDENLGVLRLR